MKNKAIKQNTKSPEQIQKEQLERRLEEKQENIVIGAREKLLPILTKNNLTIEHTKMVLDVLALVIQQGQFNLAQKHVVSDLNLLEEITDQYPEYNSVKEIILAINDMNTMDSIHILQWMLEKVKKIIDDENKERKFEELKLTF